MNLNELRLAAKASNPALALWLALWPYIVAALLVILFTGWVYFEGRSDGKESNQAKVEWAKTKTGEWKARAEAAERANASQVALAAVARAELTVCQSEADRLADEGLAAVQKAEAESHRAEASLAEWQRKYRTSKTAKCDAALKNMAAVCPSGDF